MANKSISKRRLGYCGKVIFIIIGAFLMALGIELFLVPNQIIDGGIVGISIIISQLTSIKLGLFLFVLNLPFLYVGYRKIGKLFAVYTLLGVTSMSIFTVLLHSFEPITRDPLLATVFGGIILGTGVGIVLRAGGSLDGTEILALIINSKVTWSVGQIIMFFNVFILGSAGFIFGWDNAMYSLLTYYIAFKVIDIVVEGLDESKVMWIISDEYKEISSELMKSLGRGVTYLNGQGAYSEDERKVIFFVVHRLEEAKVKSIVTDIDENAFIAVGHINDVHGSQFNKSATVH